MFRVVEKQKRRGQFVLVWDMHGEHGLPVRDIIHTYHDVGHTVFPSHTAAVAQRQRPVLGRIADHPPQVNGQKAAVLEILHAMLLQQALSKAMRRGLIVVHVGLLSRRLYVAARIMRTTQRCTQVQNEVCTGQFFQ